MATTEDRSTTVRPRRSSERAWIGGLGALMTTVTVGTMAGLPGVLAGGLLIGLWYARLPIYGFALGHVVLVVLFPDPIPMVRLGIIEAGLVGMVAGAGYRPDDAHGHGMIREFAALGVGLGCLVAVGWVVGQSTDAIWVVAGAIVTAVAVGTYGLHRYELVRLGLVEEGDPT